MGLENLFGNTQLKENLSASLRAGHISHFYLISGPAGSGKRTLKTLLCAAILCQEADKPCLSCPVCRKVMSGNHPDVITVDDPEKKIVSVELIRRARADIFIRPNEAQWKIYCIERAQDMSIGAQNALLKVLEEPPEYGVFLLLTDNPDKLLPTVRSRCTHLRMEPLEDALLHKKLVSAFPEASPQAVESAVFRSGGYYGQAVSLLSEGSDLLPQTEEFLRSYSEKDAFGLLQVLVPMEKWKREQLLPVLQQWMALLTAALSGRSGLPAPAVCRQPAEKRSARELAVAVTCLRKAIDYVNANVSCAAVCGYLEWVLR